MFLVAAYGSSYVTLVRQAGMGFSYDAENDLIIGEPTVGYKTSRWPLPAPCRRFIWRFFKPAHAVDKLVRPAMWSPTSRPATPKDMKVFTQPKRG
jgi:hypothetical protein